MSLPTMTGTARLIQDPELRFAASGSAVVKVRLAFNSRKKDPQSGEWKDDAVFFVDGKAFGQAAENIAASLSKGVEVVVSGRLKTEQWETNGEKRSGTALLIDAIGPALRGATAVVEKAGGSGQGQQQYAQARARSSQEGRQDPWATSGAAAEAAQASPWNEEPPF